MTAFEKIWSDYRSGIKAFLHGRLSDPSDVEDLLQEILLRSHQNLDGLKSRDSVKAWLYRIARNAVIDHYRKRRGADGIHPEDLWYGAGEDEGEHEFARCVRPFINALPEEAARMLTAIDLNGQSQKDYAAEMGLNYSTLKSRLQQGRKQLRDLFQECCTMSVDRWGNVVDYRRKSGRCEPE